MGFYTWSLLVTKISFRRIVFFPKNLEEYLWIFSHFVKQFCHFWSKNSKYGVFGWHICNFWSKTQKIYGLWVGDTEHYYLKMVFGWGVSWKRGVWRDLHSIPLRSAPCLIAIKEKHANDAFAWWTTVSGFKWATAVCTCTSKTCMESSVNKATYLPSVFIGCIRFRIIGFQVWFKHFGIIFYIVWGMA